MLKKVFMPMKNSAFEKCYENMRNLVNAFLVWEEWDLFNRRDNFNMTFFKILNENMAIVAPRKPKLKWLNSTIAGI